MQLTAELDVFYDDVPQSAAMNMAIDEALLQFASRPALRFYGWRAPALSFGYFSSFADVADEATERELVRRWTGGGIVLHGEDFTYSIVLPGVRSVASRTIYSQVHNAIQSALPHTMNVALAEQASPKISESCFANPVEADVLLEGRKIAGAAQRRTRAGLLHQGSIQHDALPQDFGDRFAVALCPRFRRTNLTSELLREAQIIATNRYATEQWLRRR